DEGELVSLGELGVESIALTYSDDSEARTAADGDVLIHGQSDVTWSDGRITQADDASFAINAADVLIESDEIALPPAGDSDSVDTVTDAAREPATSSVPDGAAEIASLEADLLFGNGLDDKSDPGTVDH
ncbi:MAG: hypothetical protein V2I82_11290, partial [Halieaceae bacterium]|nr:hypothetical protein [Halieaceae bacterium]